MKFSRKVKNLAMLSGLGAILSCGVASATRQFPLSPAERQKLTQLRTLADDPTFQEHAALHFLRIDSDTRANLALLANKINPTGKKYLDEIIDLYNTPYYFNHCILSQDSQIFLMEFMSGALAQKLELILPPGLNQVFTTFLTPSKRDLSCTLRDVYSYPWAYKEFLQFLQLDTQSMYQEIKSWRAELANHLQRQIEEVLQWPCLTYQNDEPADGANGLVVIPPHNLLQSAQKGDPTFVSQIWPCYGLALGDLVLASLPSTQSAVQQQCLKLEVIDGALGIPLVQFAGVFNEIPQGFGGESTPLEEVLHQLYPPEAVDHETVQKMFKDDIVNYITNQVMVALSLTAESLFKINEEEEDNYARSQPLTTPLSDLSTKLLRLGFASKVNIHLYDRRPSPKNALDKTQFISSKWPETPSAIFLNVVKKSRNDFDTDPMTEYQVGVCSTKNDNVTMISLGNNSIFNINLNEYIISISTSDLDKTDQKPLLPGVTLDFGHRKSDDLPMLTAEDLSHQYRKLSKKGLPANQVVQLKVIGQRGNHQKVGKVNATFENWQAALAKRANTLINRDYPFIGKVESLLEDMTTHIFDTHQHLGESARLLVEHKIQQLTSPQLVIENIKQAVITNFLPGWRDEAAKSTKPYVKTVYLVDVPSPEAVNDVFDPNNIESLPAAFPSHEDIEQPIQHKKGRLFVYYKSEKDRNHQRTEECYIGLTWRSRLVETPESEGFSLKTLYPSYFYPAVKMFDIDLDDNPQLLHALTLLANPHGTQP